MTAIGFSTGALALSDFDTALTVLSHTDANAVELSALRQHELTPLLTALPHLELQQFEHISIHLPSAVDPGFEESLVDCAKSLPPSWPLIAHPDIISRWNLWRGLGERLCIENMDKRKPIGQTARDLRSVFDQLPEATCCLDLGHIHQVDPTMGEAVLVLEQLRSRLRQLHISEVNSQSKHDPISRESSHAFSLVAHLIPKGIPVILESRIAPLTASAVQSEIDFAREVLQDFTAIELAGD